MKFLFIILSLFWLSSCNETPIDYNVPPNPKLINNYFPLNVNNYWVYDYFEFDDDNEQYPNSIAIDSLVAVDTFYWYGTKGFILKHFRDNVLIDSMKIISEQDSVYLIVDSSYVKSGIFSDFPLQLLNIRASSWLTINQNYLLENIWIYDSFYQANSFIRLYTNYEGDFTLAINDSVYLAKSHNEILDKKSLINNAKNASNENVNVELFQRQVFARSFSDSIGLVLEIKQPENVIVREFQNDVQINEIVYKSRGYTLKLRSYFIKDD